MWILRWVQEMLNKVPKGNKTKTPNRQTYTHLKPQINKHTFKTPSRQTHTHFKAPICPLARGTNILLAQLTQQVIIELLIFPGIAVGWRPAQGQANMNVCWAGRKMRQMFR